MRVLIKEKLSAHRMKTPEGFLICTDAVIARTGAQSYMKSELFPDCTDSDYVDVNRYEDDVFSNETLASFENKPVTWDHPDENVTPNNYRQLSVGYVRNVRRGTSDGKPVMVGDIIITDAEAIKKILDGDHNELSCGYDCDIMQDGQGFKQSNIRGNHVALCEQGRAGIAKLADSTNKDAANHYFRLDKRKNDYDEYVVKEYVNGKFREDGSYYTDDWDDAVGTMKDIAKRLGMTVKQHGSGFIADSKVNDKLTGNGEVHFLYQGSKIKANVWNKDDKSISELTAIARKYGCKIEPMDRHWSDVWLIGQAGKEEELCKAWHEINPNYSVNELMSLHDSVKDGVSPMTYAKLKELGYSSDDWSDWSDEEKVKRSQEGKKSEGKSEKKEAKSEGSKKELSKEQQERRQKEVPAKVRYSNMSEGLAKSFAKELSKFGIKTTTSNTPEYDKNGQYKSDGSYQISMRGSEEAFTKYVLSTLEPSSTREETEKNIVKEVKSLYGNDFDIDDVRDLVDEYFENDDTAQKMSKQENEKSYEEHKKEVSNAEEYDVEGLDKAFDEIADEIWESRKRSELKSLFKNGQGDRGEKSGVFQLNLPKKAWDEDDEEYKAKINRANELLQERLPGYEIKSDKNGRFEVLAKKRSKDSKPSDINIGDALNAINALKAYKKVKLVAKVKK